MTIVEFYDGVSIHNMVSCLTMNPEKIIFLGERKMMLSEEETYKRFVKQKGMEVTFDFRSIHRNSLEQIIDVLESIVEEEEICVFDLTGGDDLVLVATGIVYERYKETKNIQMHRFNIKSGTIADTDHDGIIPATEMPKISVEDNVSLYGGCMIPRDGDEGTYHWDFNDEFVEDLMDLWDICRSNPVLWNSQTTLIAQAASVQSAEQQLKVSPEKKKRQEKLQRERNKVLLNSEIVSGLRKKGLINCNRIEDDNLLITFKNDQIKECLTKAGNVLELVVTYYGSIAKDNKGLTVYDDVVNGAFIDWDAEIHSMKDSVRDTTNEIDVLLMKGMVPIFVSCKNGNIDQEELYKLHTVAERFGGPYAKKVLICTSYGKSVGAAHEHFVQRAKDMNIHLIENVHELSSTEFMAKVRNLWN